MHHFSALFLLQRFQLHITDDQGLPSNDYLIIISITFIVTTIGLLSYNLYKNKKEFKTLSKVYGKLFNNPNYGVLLYNITDTYIVDTNQYLPDILGYTKEEFRIINPTNFVIANEDENIEDKRDAVFNRAYVKANGERISINVSRTFFRDNGCEFLLYIFRSNSDKDNNTVTKSITQDISKNSNEQLNKDRKLILVAENYDNNYILTKAILDCSFDIIRAYNGEEAINLACSIKPDIILMNTQMPIIDGFEATRTLRTKGIKIPIIAFTATLEDCDGELIRNTGFTGHVIKPISRKELMDVITNNINQAP